MGIRIGEAGRWGIGFDDFESGMELLSLEAYAHPKTIGLVMKMFDEFKWWENNFFSMFKAKKGLITADGRPACFRSSRAFWRRTSRATPARR